MKSGRLRAYMYPLTSRGGVMVNPYINHFIEALDDKFEFINRLKPADSGVFDLLKYFNRIDYIFLNWPEEIPGKKGGVVQSIFLILLLNYFKIRKIKIVWTLHNRESHYDVRMKLKSYIYKYVAKKADFIITHSGEGVSYAKTLTEHQKKEILFFHHPVPAPVDIPSLRPKKYDVLIWGTVAPYKGVDSFLEYMHEHKIDDLQILIVGKIVRDYLKEKLFSFRSKRTDIIDDYLSHEELAKYIVQSRVVLFTYNPSSVLSSGALMDTLVFAPIILGPDFGAFKDLREEGLIYTYTDFKDLFEKIHNLIENKENKISSIQSFCEKNSWSNFGKALSEALLKIKHA